MFQFRIRKPPLLAKPVKLSMDQIPKIRTKQSFLENGFQPISLVGGAVNHDLFVGRAGEKKSIDNKFEIEIISSLDKGSNRKHIFRGERF